MSLKSLVKWPGGKADEIKLFQQHIPMDYDTYLEPFVGGGALYFHLSPQKAVINDIHPELVAFYQAIGDGHGEAIHKFMGDHPNTEEVYYQVRNLATNNQLEKARRFYYLRKLCYRGMLRYNQSGGFNVPYGRYKTCNYKDLTDDRYRNLLGRTEILNCNFEEIFIRYNDERNFMFLDPPYLSAFSDYWTGTFGETEHRRLADLFKSTKIRCLMVIGSTPLLEELYNGFIVDRYKKKYRFRLHSGRVGSEIDNDHLVIKNF